MITVTSYAPFTRSEHNPPRWGSCSLHYLATCTRHVSATFGPCRSFSLMVTWLAVILLCFVLSCQLEQSVLSTQLSPTIMSSLDIHPYPSYGLPLVSEPLSYVPSADQLFTYEPPTPMYVTKVSYWHSSDWGRFFRCSNVQEVMSERTVSATWLGWCVC
jgi:hypothetical protein